MIDHQGQYHRYDPLSATRPLSGLLERILERVSGTWQCCNVALEKGFCLSTLGGGMHHAQKSFGNGFCLLNDIVIAIRKLQADKRIKTAWVIDVDAHKGDGTAALTADDPWIVTFSIHMGRGWPLDDQHEIATGRLNPSFYPQRPRHSGLPGEDHLYLVKLEEGLREWPPGRSPTLP